MYVAEYIVDVLLVDYDFRAARRCEQTAQLLAVNLVDVDCEYLVARSHAVAQVSRGEVERIVKYLDLVLDSLLFLIDVVDCTLQILVEVAHRKQSGGSLLVAYAEQFHQCPRQPCREQ